MTVEERKCPNCGAELPANAPKGLCPQCLMKAGMQAGSEAVIGGSLEANQSIPTGAVSANRFVPPEPARLAEKFPQLEILELLGQGGMGAVYKARQRQLDRLVALKILPPEVSKEPAFAERFSREARSLAKLNHPGLVSVFDFGRTEDGLYYFVMEFVDGTDLRRVIQAGQLRPAEALAIVPQICEALQFAHEEGIVHRDIKPENILLDKKGRVKIADFGLAKLLDRPPIANTLTQAGQRMGTPHYMAPEQIEGAHEVDHRADIYSLGVVFYEMLTGQLPIGRFAPPSQKVQVDVRLDNVVLKSLEHEPERRYQQASDVKTDVEQISSTARPAATGLQKSRPASAPNPMEKHVTIIGALKIAFGAMGLLGALIVLVAVTGGGALSQDPTAMRITAMVGPVISILIAVTSIPGIIAGIGLLKRRPWARILMIILGVLDLLSVPFGTILGIYILWALLKEQTVQLFKQPSLVTSRKEPA